LEGLAKVQRINGITKAALSLASNLSYDRRKSSPRTSGSQLGLLVKDKKVVCVHVTELYNSIWEKFASATTSMTEKYF